MKYLLYCINTDKLEKVTEAPPEGYCWELWKPKLFDIRPSGTPVYFTIWWLFHHIRLFRNREFHVALVRRGQKLVHYSLISPGYFRFPFMRDSDLTIGDSWTAPSHRGKGLYTFVLGRAARQFSKPGRKMWTIHAEGNEGSRKSFIRAGYKFVGMVERTNRFGIRLLGAYHRV